MKKKRKFKLLFFKRLKIPWICMEKIMKYFSLERTEHSETKGGSALSKLGERNKEKGQELCSSSWMMSVGGELILFFFHLSDTASAQPHRLLHAPLAVVVSSVRDTGQSLHRAGGALLPLPGTADVHRTRPLADPLPGEMLLGLHLSGMTSPRAEQGMLEGRKTSPAAWGCRVGWELGGQDADVRSSCWLHNLQQGRGHTCQEQSCCHRGTSTAGAHLL